MPAPAELTLELTPRARYDVIDVRARLAEIDRDLLGAYPRAVYCSHHTTAGYLEQSLLGRLEYSRQYLDPFIRVFQRLFPPGADYRHDRLDLRTELTEQERRVEPKNADSHLAFIGSGLRNCVTYVHRRERPVYFIDLDGVVPEGARRRRTTILAYEREELVEEVELAVPVSTHPIDSVNLREPRYGLFEHAEELVRRHGVEHGRVDLTLSAGEGRAGLTVNEYETLLMRHDLAEVLHDPVRFMAQKGRNMLRDPLAIPNKTINYASYDLVQVLNETIDKLQMSESAIESLLARCLGIPMSRFLRLRGSISLLVTPERTDTSIVCGRYQSPILVQWGKPAGGAERRLSLRLVRLY